MDMVYFSPFPAFQPISLLCSFPFWVQFSTPYTALFQVVSFLNMSNLKKVEFFEIDFGMVKVLIRLRMYK